MSTRPMAQDNPRTDIESRLIPLAEDLQQLVISIQQRYLQSDTFCITLEPLHKMGHSLFWYQISLHACMWCMQIYN